MSYPARGEGLVNMIQTYSMSRKKNQPQKFGRKTTVGIFQATDKRNLTREDLDEKTWTASNLLPKKSKP